MKSRTADLFPSRAPRSFYRRDHFCVTLAKPHFQNKKPIIISTAQHPTKTKPQHQNTTIILFLSLSFPYSIKIHLHAVVTTTIVHIVRAGSVISSICDFDCG
jgi:hypothetical protein